MTSKETFEILGKYSIYAGGPVLVKDLVEYKTIKKDLEQLEILKK